jgi:hypothetical protein
VPECQPLPPCARLPAAAKDSGACVTPCGVVMLPGAACTCLKYCSPRAVTEASAASAEGPANIHIHVLVIFQAKRSKTLK